MDARELASWDVLSEFKLICGPDRLVPDIVVAGPGSKCVGSDWLSPASAAIEILSPGQTIGDLCNREDRIVAKGHTFMHSDLARTETRLGLFEE